MQYAVRHIRRPGLTRDLPYGPEDLFWVSNAATLVMGEQDAVLIDTFVTAEQNQQLIDWVRSFGRRLTHVYVTHGHGDHFFGLGQIAQAFPSVRAVGTDATVAGAEAQVTPDKLVSFWQRLFPEQIPDRLTVPEPLGDDHLELEGQRLDIVETGFTDTAGSTVVWVPALRLIAAGDVAYDDTHPYLAESTTATRREWAATLDRLGELDPAAVVAAHKNPDRPDDPRILAETAAYLREFNQLDADTTTAEELYRAMLDRHPRRINPGSLWSAAQRAKQPALR
ncbi:MBL fold metallo-hydrolase [Micromonospora sp. WMMD967]|uniref:MBL fold metallo-hydrolase n=1 Tax=Micromonospora sp. WMMD967 TaxID=3016101 RepID=UPI002417E0F1|nr:MBL fold metallo-hydrolase [Micromonospora sp. WMMD967]MDG4837672.1 MBL fold metallo-hydrolase [Micromonospora sp. WMMD967]